MKNNKSNKQFVVKYVPKFDALGNPIMIQVTDGLDRMYTERLVIPTGSWKKTKQVVPTKVVTKLGFNPYTRKHFEYQKLIPRHVEYKKVWVPGKDVVKEIVINPPNIHYVQACDVQRIPIDVDVNSPEVCVKKWTELINSSKTIKEVATACTTICADKSFIKQYSEGPAQAGTVSKKRWYDICQEYSFPYSFKHLENWKLQVSVLDPIHEYKIIPGVLDDNGMPKIAKPVCDEITGKTIYDPETGKPVYKEVNLYTKYAPSTIFNPETESYEKHYYTSKRYPYKEAMELLKEAGAVEVYDAFKEVYYLYATLNSRCRKTNGWQLKEGSAALLNRMLKRYKEAHEALYRYNASFISASRDVKKMCVDLEFETKLKAEEGTHRADNFTLSDEDKIVIAAAVFEFGIVDADLVDGVFDSHAETFRFKEHYTMQISGIADAPRTIDDPHQWTTYHDVENTDPTLTFLGKRIVKVFSGDTKAKLLECYNWVMSLSEEDREPFYRTWVDDEGVTNTIRNLDDYAKMHWQLPQDKKCMGNRDYQIGLYADEGVDEEDIEYLFNELSDALPEIDAVQDEDVDDLNSCIDEEDEDED